MTAITTTPDITTVWTLGTDLDLDRRGVLDLLTLATDLKFDRRPKNS